MELLEIQKAKSGRLVSGKTVDNKEASTVEVEGDVNDKSCQSEDIEITEKIPYELDIEEDKLSTKLTEEVNMNSVNHETLNSLEDEEDKVDRKLNVGDAQPSDLNLSGVTLPVDPKSIRSTSTPFVGATLDSAAKIKLSLPVLDRDSSLGCSSSHLPFFSPINLKLLSKEIVTDNLLINNLQVGDVSEQDNGSSSEAVKPISQYDSAKKTENINIPIPNKPKSPDKKAKKKEINVDLLVQNNLAWGHHRGECWDRD